MFNIKSADWSKSIVTEAKRDKEVLVFMLDNNVKFSGFQGFAKYSGEIDIPVPDTFPLSRLDILNDANEIEESRQMTFSEYFGKIDRANDNQSYLIFLPSYRNRALNNLEMKASTDFFGIENILTLSEGKKLLKQEHTLNKEFLMSLSIEDLKLWLQQRNIDSLFDLRKTSTLSDEVIEHFNLNED